MGKDAAATTAPKEPKVPKVKTTGGEGDGAEDAALGAASAIPYVGMAINIAQIGMGLVNSSQQAAADRDAQRSAEISTKLQLQQQEQEFFKKVQIPMEAYNRALREGTAQQAQAISALQEGDARLNLGNIGKVQAVGVDQIAGQTDAMAQQMFELSKLQAQEGMLGADDIAKIYENRTIGAQKASAAAKLAEVAALTSAATGATDLATRIDAGRKEYKTQQPAVQGVEGSMPSYYAGNEPFFSTTPGGQSPTTQVGSMFGPQQSIFPSVSAPQTQQMDWSQDPNNWKVNPFR
jgi:hypothetical protein